MWVHRIKKKWSITYKADSPWLQALEIRFILLHKVSGKKNRFKGPWKMGWRQVVQNRITVWDTRVYFIYGRKVLGMVCSASVILCKPKTILQLRGYFSKCTCLLTQKFSEFYLKEKLEMGTKILNTGKFIFAALWKER